MATPPVECKASPTAAHAAAVRRIQYPRATPERQAVRKEYILIKRAACSEYLHPVFVCSICCVLAPRLSANCQPIHPIEIRGSLERNTPMRNCVCLLHRWRYSR
jgi:hypothetical protein